MEEYFRFLERLRKSGITNMFGAVPYLMEFFQIEKEEAKDILLKWMENYEKGE
jgi:hypothetical protein